MQIGEEIAFFVTLILLLIVLLFGISLLGAQNISVFMPLFQAFLLILRVFTRVLVIFALEQDLD